MACIEVMTGIIYGIGVGPGDPELLTIKAARLIKAADVIAYPAPETGNSFARSIAAALIAPDKEEVAIRMNIGDGTFPKDEVYDKAASLIANHASSGKSVAVLCEGDPLFYGSFYYLLSRLMDRHRIEIVPGVSSLMACAAATGLPLSFGAQCLTIIPATLSDDELFGKISACERIAIMKLGRHLPRVRHVLRTLKRDDQAFYIAHATLPSVSVLKLNDFISETAPYFSMILVGKAQ